jgi:hypothetical protein
VVGPPIWTMSHDEDDPFEDGWDWLAATDTLIQGFGVYLILKGGSAPRGNQVTVSPLGRHGAHGLAISGSF